MDDLVFASVQKLAETIRNRHVSATEVLDAHLAQIDRHNPRLNVIVTLNRDEARVRASQADAALARGELWGPLHGVPITIKDGFSTAGIRTTSGFPLRADHVPEVDAPVVKRLRTAGAILLGKTNLPILSMDAQADNPIFGRTNNPWNLSRTSGGSTGGAAAVAAGLTSLELGSDIGGSLRIPAHCCGIYSLKPSAYRLPGGGYHPNPEPALPDIGGPAQVGVFGPLARSVDDLALAFYIMAGADPHSWAVPPVPVEPMPVLKLEKLRLAWIDDFGGVPVCAEIRAVLAHLVEELGRQGCDIQRYVPASFNFVTVWETWGELLAVAMGQNPYLVASFVGSDNLETPISRGISSGVQLTLPEYFTSLRKRSQLITTLEVFFQEWDALICPVMAVPAFPHCAQNTPILVDGQLVDYSTALLSYTCPFNLSGHPVVVLPAANSREGLPIGLQVVGRRWGEGRLLAIAKTLSQVTEGYQRPPGY